MTGRSTINQEATMASRTQAGAAGETQPTDAEQAGEITLPPVPPVPPVASETDGDDSGPATDYPTTPAEVPESEPTEAERILGAPTADLVLRQHWDDADGKPHLPGTTITVDAVTALTLLATRWATRADVPDPAEDSDSEPAPATV